MTSIKWNSFHILLVTIIFIVTLEIVIVKCDSTNATIRNVRESAISKELKLTAKEKAAFDQLKRRMLDKIPRDLELARQDLYFLRSVRAHNLNVDSAERDFKEMVDFIKENKIMTILTEDWSDMEELYPLYVDAVDRQNRPILYVTLQGAWNLRQGYLQGLQPRMIRYFYKMVMEGYDKILEANKKQANVTQFLLIMDMDGFNLFQQGCPACISMFFYLLDLYERWIPGYSNEIIMINAPSSIYVLLQSLRSALSEHTNSVLKIFGTNRNRWKPYLDERIDPKQTPWFLGGTKKVLN